ncbi:MAG: tyrosine-protein phosphatase [Planctomycetia bacterium]|nr:tyrosine-protein phosphatase [Planctomycetia bacterium]
MVRLLVTRFLIGLIALATLALPVAYYRYHYVQTKRIRVVTEGKMYRCGQLTMAGFKDVIQRYGIRTIINLQDEDVDPRLSDSKMRESAFCKQMGVNYVYMPPKLVASGEPLSIEKFLAVCDDKNAYPILLHCKAGLHRTGTMAAFYRIEYEGWTPDAAIQELMTNGFSLKQCHVKNPYIKNYLVDYVPRAQRYAMHQSSSQVEAATPP